MTKTEKLFYKHFCMPFKRFHLKKYSVQAADQDHTISFNHANAFLNVGIAHTSNHFANQLAFHPKAPSGDPFKEKLYIWILSLQ